MTPTRSTPRPAQAPQLARLRVTLLETSPAVWRDVLVPYDIPLALLHRTLITVMGWQGYHLHQFLHDDMRYGIRDDSDVPDDTVPYDALTLRHLAPEVGSIIRYEYDFGDSWMHEIVVDGVLLFTPTMRVPFCVDGASACPPEDVGGIHGYAIMVDVLANRPNSAEAEEYDTWLGCRFDSAAFHPRCINAELFRLVATDERFGLLYPDVPSRTAFDL